LFPYASRTERLFHQVRPPAPDVDPDFLRQLVRRLNRPPGPPRLHVVDLRQEGCEPRIALVDLDLLLIHEASLVQEAGVLELVGRVLAVAFPEQAEVQIGMCQFGVVGLLNRLRARAGVVFDQPGVDVEPFEGFFDGLPLGRQLQHS
jgi:hypothetical protein